MKPKKKGRSSYEKMFAGILALVMVLGIGMVPGMAATEGPETGCDPAPIHRIAPRVLWHPGCTLGTTGSVNMRKGPGLSFAIVVNLAKDTKLDAIEADYDMDGDQWVKVKVQSGTNKGKTGWVSGYYLELLEAAR